MARVKFLSFFAARYLDGLMGAREKDERIEDSKKAKGDVARRV